MGLHSTQDTDEGGKIYIWEITETEEELRNICGAIPQDEEEELTLIKGESRRKEKLAERALLNYIYPEKVYLGHHDNGKPYIQQNAVEISISHTYRFVAILLHDEEDVGIDIESLDRDFAAVETKALSEDEREDLSEKNRNLHLAIYWSAKEAIYKRMSQNGIDFASQIKVEKFNPKENGELEATFIHKDGEEEEFRLDYQIFENHIMVWLEG